MQLKIEPTKHIIWTEDFELRRVESCLQPESRKLKTHNEWEPRTFHSQKEFKYEMSGYLTPIEYRFLFNKWPKRCQTVEIPFARYLFSTLASQKENDTRSYTTIFENKYKTAQKSVVDYNAKKPDEEPLTRTMLSLLCNHVLNREAELLNNKIRTVFAYLNKYPFLDILTVRSEIACSNHTEFFKLVKQEAELDGKIYSISYKPEVDS